MTRQKNNIDFEGKVELIWEEEEMDNDKSKT